MEGGVMRRFGELARDTRVKARVSLRRVADELGLSAAYVSDIERGNRNPPAPEVARSWAELVEGDEEEFVLTAQRDRPTAELTINRSSARGPEAAFMLAREFPHLTEDDYEEIMKVVRNRQEANGNG